MNKRERLEDLLRERDQLTVDNTGDFARFTVMVQNLERRIQRARLAEAAHVEVAAYTRDNRD